MILGMPAADIGERDPHWASVVSLLSFDESDGSTSYVDAKGRSWTTTGGHSVSHSQSRFGAGSLRRSGAFRSSIDCTDAETAIGTSDFTMECWVRPDAASNRSLFAWDFASGVPQALEYLADPWFWTYFRNRNVLMTPAARDLNTWIHFAVVRQGSTLRHFIGGAMAGFTATESTDFAAGVRIGDFNHGNPAVAHVDEFRLTVGVARYTSAFTPRTTRFPRR